MKYGIITYHGIPNFGAILQGFALCDYVRECGAECDIVNYKCKNLEERELRYHKSSNWFKNIIKKNTVWKKRVKKIEACRSFEKPMYGQKEYSIINIKEANLEYDGFIAGSDMIWNLNVNGDDMTFFLDFADPEKKKIAYAASVGEKWSDNDINKVEKYLAQFNYISVREEDTNNQINNDMNIDSLCVPDPTMLLEPDIWNQYIHEVKEKNYVLVYFPYDEILEAAKRYAKKTNKKLIVISEEINIFNKELKSIYSPQEFLSYIYYADAIFTDSYHGILFSIYFKKQFWTNNTGNRIISFLEKTNLNNCLIHNDMKFSNVIDYNSVNVSIEKMRTYGREYLRNALKEEK